MAESYFSKIALYRNSHLRPYTCNYIKKETLAQVFSCELWSTASAFRFFTVTLLRWRTTNIVWKTSDEYSLSRNSEAQSQYIFLGSIDFQCIFSLVYTVYCPRITRCYLSILLYIQYLLPQHCYCC